MTLTWLLALVWEPIASPLRIGAGAVVLALLAVFAYVGIARVRPWAAVSLLLMRLGVIAAVTTLLFGPSRELPQSPQAERPRLTVLVDTSESMRTGDCAGASRIELVANEVLTPQRLQDWREQFELDMQAFDAVVHPLPQGELHSRPVEVAAGKATHLSAAVSRSLNRLSGGEAGDMLLVISDGRDTEDAPLQPAAELAASKGIPIFAVGVGGDRSEVDAAVLAVPMQDVLLPGEPGGILLKVFQSGLDDASATARLTGGEETQSVALPFAGTQVVETQFSVQREEPGQYEFEVSLEPLSGEADLANNVQTVFVEVIKRRIRVLLLEGEPHWDTKFLAQSLRKDEQVELTQLTQVAATKQETIVSRREGAAPRIPATAEEWSEFDVVVLGRGLDRLLDRPAAESLVTFVRDGGGHVIFARGAAWERGSPEGEGLQAALGVLEPVVWGDAVQSELSLSLTPSGRTTAWFATTKMGVDVEAAFARLPGFEQLISIEREKTGTLVLARAQAAANPQADGLPAITRMAYGRGQVVSILGAGLWRWGLLPPVLQELRGFYDTFWSNLVRWLALGGDFAPGQQVSLQLSRTSVRLSDEATLDVVFRQPPPDGAEPQLTIHRPDGASADEALHRLPGQALRYRATLQPTQLGVHTATVRTPGATSTTLEKRFNVYEVNLERLQTSANFPALQMLAKHSGGAMFDTSDSNALQLQLQLQRHRESRITPPQREYVWDHGLIMTLLLSWAGVEWLFRRAVGLW